MTQDSRQAETKATPKTFTDYQRTKVTLIQDLERLRKYSQDLSLNASIEIIDDVLERVQSSSFSVAVVGEFKRGKSTFINALLGQDILPSDVNPCSATLNRVTYGLTKRVQIVYKDGREEEIGIDQLSEYVTKLTPESEDKAIHIKEAVVHYPVQYCQNNVDIIDTPGLNDDASMTEVTRSVLPSVDAAIMLIQANSPFGESEQKFLETDLLTNDLGRIIFVVTAIDRYNSPEDADKGVKYIRDRIKRLVLQRAKDQYGEDSPEYEVYKKKIGDPRIIGLSAYQALKAKQSGDGELLEKSRFPEFETMLENFLADERGSVVLQVPVNRLIASATEILSKLNMKLNSLSMEKEDFQASYENSVAEIIALRTRNDEEMKLIDAAAENVKRHVEPLILQLEDELKQAAQEAINLAEIDPRRELKNKQALIEKLGKQVSDAVEKAAKKQAEKIQYEIDQGLFKAISRLQEFAMSIDFAIQRIEMQFVSISTEETTRRNASGEGMAEIVAFATGLGGAWMGFKEAGVKGAAVGAAGNVGGLFAGFMAVMMIGIPITWPVTMVVGVLSMLGGRELTKAIFAGERAENFKADYQKAVLVEIEKQLRKNPIDRKINDQISEIFDTLQMKVRQQVDASIDNTQDTLTELYTQRERNEVLSEQEQRDLNQKSDETQQILGNAQRLSKQLLQEINIASA
ncbi:dynamin family protein [Pseudanabaena sp. BC1403]|uniref:dynamin family protein n=1 Tax=Pseudanabaena sp. BC1403 TaxID=2043171 RepID=UPI000CD8F607|nr:dynamin family protein [Pseudanabaena sp. BC1403]